ncbi:hypothetical protein FDG2_1816 [Candidatus Protofrankia californiensis]|uniref:Uncharacterized protein n=1 Tax=Candidatus Protofrankia californiensis TaxID=1839754 RepID=A0A1C3NWD4_9ACTN|nr:hypothetical protein FDG2_1816 [Candidatus Protofrankia californiensis]
MADQCSGPVDDDHLDLHGRPAQRRPGCLGEPAPPVSPVRTSSPSTVLVLIIWMRPVSTR